MSAEEAYGKLVQRYKEANVLDSCGCVLEWDERTYLPKAGGEHRADQLALLAGMVHDRCTNPEIDELLKELEESELTNPVRSVEAVNVREWRRSFDRMKKLPKSLVEEMTRATTVGQQVWTEARAACDFGSFSSTLENILRLKKEEAKCLADEGTPYDALLDDYEPGESTENLNVIFSALRDALVTLVQEIGDSSRKPDISILNRDYPVSAQEKFGKAAAEAIGYDFNRGRLDVTTHPFCMWLGPYDTRITTRYDKNAFSQAFFGTLHEAGHGIYDQGLDKQHWGTPMGESVSLGIHESQSRMWENFVGRSPAFWTHFFPGAQRMFPEALGNVSRESFVFAINDVRPSPIRVEADEVTYNLHILLRFEMEQALINEDLPAEDVPEKWNETFESFLGFRPKDDADGCLQDVHWSGGMIGYFPTYALGNLYAAQLLDEARSDLGELDAQFAEGEFAPLREWMAEKVYRQGNRFRPGELVQEITGKPLSHEPLVRYLRTRFGTLYDL